MRRRILLIHFGVSGPSFEPDFPVYAVVVPNFDAKSALASTEPSSVALIFAIDTLTIGESNSDILFPHELFHAFHAAQSGFSNDGVMKYARSSHLSGKRGWRPT
jgi:hypothetical protein